MVIAKTCMLLLHHHGYPAMRAPDVVYQHHIWVSCQSFISFCGIFHYYKSQYKTFRLVLTQKPLHSLSKHGVFRNMDLPSTYTEHKRAIIIIYNILGVSWKAKTWLLMYGIGVFATWFGLLAFLQQIRTFHLNHI